MSALLYVPFCLHYCFVNIVELFITFVPFCISLVWSLSAAVQVEITFIIPCFTAVGAQNVNSCS